MANWKAFASGFMTDQARQINERVARAQAYEDKQREEFERSKSTFKKIRRYRYADKSCSS